MPALHHTILPVASESTTPSISRAGWAASGPGSFATSSML